MTIASKKKIAWAMMSGGAGATLLFAVMLWLDGRELQSHQWPVYAWPTLGTGAAIYGWRWLRALYRAEPLVPPAAGTVSLTDLIFATVFAGVWSLVAASNERFVMLTPLAALAGFVLYLGSALAASLHGVLDTTWRPVFIVSHVCATLGAMGVVSLVLVTGLTLVLDGPAHYPLFLNDLFTFGEPYPVKWFLILKVMLLALPVGIVALVVLNAIGVGKKDGAAQ